MSTENQNLSQQEIDQLFGVSDQSAVADSVEPSASLAVQPYDFRRPSRISKGRYRSLEAMYGLVAKSVESWLGGRVREQLEVELLSVEQFSFTEYLLSLDSPCSAFIYDIDGTGGQQLVVNLGQDLAYTLLDRLLGGSAEPRIEERALTPLERRVVRVVADRAAHDLAEAWGDHVPIPTSWSRFETLPEMIQVAAPEDPVLVANLQVRFGSRRSLILLCIPFSVLERFFTDSSERRVHGPKGTPSERLVERALVEDAVKTTEMVVAVRLPATPVDMRRLATLQPGDVIQTPLPIDSLAEVLIQDRARYRARVGRKGNHVSAQILDEIAAAPSGD